MVEEFENRRTEMPDNYDKPPTLYIRGGKIEITHIPDDAQKPELPERMVSEIFEGLDRQLEVHRKMIPYTLMSLLGIIDSKLWKDIYKSHINGNQGNQ